METGIQLATISRGEEGQLLQRAVQHVMDLTKNQLMLLDLGLGVLKWPTWRMKKLNFSNPSELGKVRILKMFPYHSNKEKVFLKWIEYYVEEFNDFLTQ